MLLTKYFSLVAVLAVGPAFITANVDQTVSNIEAVTDEVNNVKDSLNSYNGGIYGALMVANAVYNAHSASEKARSNFDGPDKFSTEDSQKVMDAYNALHPQVLNTTVVGREKAHLLKKAGVGYIAQGMIANLRNEKSNFEETMKGKLSQEHYHMVQQPADRTDHEFKNTLKALQN